MKRIWDLTVSYPAVGGYRTYCIDQLNATKTLHSQKRQSACKTQIPHRETLRAKENTRTSTGVLFTVEVPQVASGFQSRPMPLKASKGHLKAGQYPFACAFGPTPQEIQSQEQRRPSMRRVFVCKKATEALLQYADLGSPAYG